MASNRKGLLGGAIAAAQTRGEQKQLPGKKRWMKLQEILDRPHGDSRTLNIDHVAELAESIAAVSLIQPLAVDELGHLLAGSHRREALAQLQKTQPQRFEELFANGIPVRVFPFSAQEDPEQAIAIEAAENEKRRDYTPAEVRDLADKLVKAGYRNTEGRPKKGEKSLTPALMTIVGKSRATVQRYLKGPEETASNEAVSVSEREKIAQRALKALIALEKSLEFDDSESKAAARFRRKVEGWLEKE